MLTKGGGYRRKRPVEEEVLARIEGGERENGERKESLGVKGESPPRCKGVRV